MEPIVTLPYSEWLVAEQLMKQLPARQGYSVYAPLSRQEKGVDLLVTRRATGKTYVAALQVKYSRAYAQPPSSDYRFGILYRTFVVPEQADFIMLAALYPSVTGSGGGKRSSWWLPLVLVFTREEMETLLASLRTRGGKPEKMFDFGFSTPKKVFQIRGVQTGARVDQSAHVFKNQVSRLRRKLGAA